MGAYPSFVGNVALSSSTTDDHYASETIMSTYIYLNWTWAAQLATVRLLLTYSNLCFHSFEIITTMLF